MSEQRHAVLAIHAFGADHELEQGELLKRRQILRRTQLAGLVILLLLLLLALGAGRTLLARDAQARALAADNATQAVVYVKTTRARSDTAATTLTLPGTLQGQVQGRYEGGVGTSLDVISAQQGVLAAERQVAQLQGQMQLLAVFLIKALGGDW